MVKLEEIFLNWLINQAWEFQTLALPNPSVGAIVTDSFNRPLSYAFHQKSGEAHAELEAIKKALIALNVLDQSRCENLNSWEVYDLILSSHQNALKDCIIYVTLEPCNHEGKTPSCAKLLTGVKIKKVFFSSYDLGSYSKGGAEYLQSKGVEVVAGVCEEKGDRLLYPFLCMREKGHFNLFKIAQYLNANYKEGQISNQSSKAFTHTQRGVADALIISGKTILYDQPRLDLRCAYRKDKTYIPVKILTKQNLNPQEYSCIHSPDITLHQNLSSLGLDKGFNIIEGGYEMLESLREHLDALLLIFAPKFRGKGEEIKQRFDLRYLHSHSMRDNGGEDVFLWLQV
ncbi:bifunctional diaminohydroxyphosphoribosylaminopyrimidine deaminase/5-amino-6-(5-phosphoribosylamino)uracil reductase RibD [Helicobacter cholecystus]|uniref:Bifunctional diaminohydroxyphosphoribosylaminopyrimidine deaminase/5-amino-6-(5-phosphoribosylamino)uracil reductase RibD n=1 Tax=Helicobacter cholecystus TaxID=45498 RepID=A0A3D8IZH1_9HELI|nr:bifunctional diaminohydroxyphosphoribosylaminopyrimidine deaminase/5-amino-6-(5-phosphoribosylamino)uracil reductase RibD [Helicobacter cholecystus]RDU69951.1 bifunctional diaminohydroxyphosphoribosylaminopyrimidine deaminase/5-amino-6-(5-phosphoribosylamino)uracil reductase RibD [Helicobacter cholecystus]VEJ24883.1 diaminohydroxyphosphoribosylaminopyrimidine deaminase [Helicobacter cholecystus]